MLWLSIALTVWATLGYLAFLKVLESKKPRIHPELGEMDAKVNDLYASVRDLTARVKSAEMGIAMRRGA